jgi:hypothetical protein
MTSVRTKVPHRHSGVHGTPLERRQRQWWRVDGISLMCRFEFCDLLGDHICRDAAWRLALSLNPLSRFI